MISRGFRVMAIVVLGAFTSACASSTVINSQPQGAKVYLDGELVGQTPYQMSDTKIVGSSTGVRLEHPGYQPRQATISRNEEFDVLACLGGVFLLVPFLWVMKYKPTHNYELVPAQGGYDAPQQPPSPPQSYPQQPR